MQAVVVAGKVQKKKLGKVWFLAAVLTLGACAAVKPIDSTIVTGLAGLKTQITNLYVGFQQDPVSAADIDAVRNQLTIIKSKSDAREGKDSKFSDAIAVIQETFERHVAARQKAVWAKVDVDDYTKNITEMIQDALDLENKRPSN